MKIFLVVSMLLNGAWISGKDLPHGWWPTQHDTLEECLERGKFFNEHSPENVIANCIVVSEENTRYDVE